MALNSADPNRFLSVLRKEQGLIDAGLEMIDQMQLAMSGNAAKDKRGGTAEVKRPIKMASKKLKPDGATDSKPNGDGDKMKGPTMVMELEEFPGVKIPTNIPIATLMAAVRHQKADIFLDNLVFTVHTEMSSPDSVQISPSSSSANMGESSEGSANSLLLSRTKESIPGVLNVTPLPSTVEVFSRIGGLGLLAKHLPIVYPETLRQIAVGSKLTGGVGLVMNFDKDSPINDNEWVKIENSDDFYEVGSPTNSHSICINLYVSTVAKFKDVLLSQDMLDGMVTSTPIAKRAPGLRQLTAGPGIPPHSMAAFGLFLSLPRFSEILLGERIGAQCMLRLVMGVTDDADGSK
jgi:baculoviral IAP repeat-containing protein 6